MTRSLTVPDPEGPSGRNRQAAYVRRVKAFLDTAPPERVRVLDLAGMAGVGPEQLRHAFKAHTNVAPIAYLNRARATRAAELLRAGRSPAEAAAAVGFFDEPHLHRHFKRLTGHTPARYAKLHGEAHDRARRPTRPRPRRYPGEESDKSKPTPR